MNLLKLLPIAIVPMRRIQNGAATETRQAGGSSGPHNLDELLLHQGHDHCPPWWRYHSLVWKLCIANALVLGCSFGVGMGLVSLLWFCLTAIVVSCVLREPLCISRTSTGKNAQPIQSVVTITATKVTLVITFTTTLVFLIHKNGWPLR